MKISDSLFFMWDLFKFFMSLVEAIKNYLEATVL